MGMMLHAVTVIKKILKNCELALLLPCISESAANESVDSNINGQKL